MPLILFELIKMLQHFSIFKIVNYISAYYIFNQTYLSDLIFAM